jgi:hypothetical protein
MSDVPDNCTVAILSKVNDLAERHGIRPYDFVATVQYDIDRHARVLAFEIVPAEEQHPAFFKMLDRIGASEGKLEGTDKQIIDTLDHALQLAPKPRRGF